MTQPKRFQFTSTDGVSVACVKWVRPQHVRGVVQIAHGLGEHMGRYAELAETLLEDEFAVYGNDHRGHGLTAKPSGSFGEFGPGGFDQLVEDMVSLRVIAKDEYRASHTFCWGTAWVRSQRSNLFSITVIQLMGWCYQALAHSTAWRALLNRCLQERIR